MRLLTRAASQGEVVPARKFWMVTAGGSDDDEHYGRGLAEWLYWPVTFKRNGLAFWNTFLDKFGSPTAVAKYRPGMTKADIDKLLAALQAIATDSGIVVPEGAAVELLNAARSGTGDYATLCKYMDEAIAKIILSQTMTTQDGSSLSQARVHADVKREVIKADADLLSESFNGEAGPARWWTDINFGEEVAAPRVMRAVEEEEDTKAQAETDLLLKDLGWERTEQGFQDVYGDGYVRTAAQAAADEKSKSGPAPESAVAGGKEQPDSTSFAADDLRTLYVYRQLLNPEDVIAWAKEQGFGSTLRPEDMHVTITYSKKPVNWMKMGGFWGWGPDTAQHLVPPGGPRLVERFGKPRPLAEGKGQEKDDKAAVVIVFTSGHLEQRHREMREAGASWDHDGYFPHVTFTYDGAEIDLDQVTPYRGELRFGPEVFEPVEDGWEDGIVEVSFAEGDGPDEGQPIELMADDLVDQLIAQSGYRAVKAMTDPILGAIRTANSAEELAQLLNQLPDDSGQMATSLENASFALRLDAEAGGEQPHDD